MTRIVIVISLLVSCAASCGALEDTPSNEESLEDGMLATANFIDGFIEVLGNVELVMDNFGMRRCGARRL